MPAQEAAFAVGVLPDICAFHRYTGNSASPAASEASSSQAPGLSPRLRRRRLKARLRALLRPMIPDNARPYVLPRLLARS